MRILLFASDDVGVQIASILSEAAAEVVCLVLDNQNRGGLNEEIQAVLSDAQIVSSDDLDDEQTTQFIRSLAPDVGIAAWWPHILRRAVFELPRLGTLNLHPSLLPFGRGRNPNFWALVEGTAFGVTIHHVDEGTDTGEIAWQRELEVSWEDTGGSLHKRAKKEIVDLFKLRLNSILSGDIPRLPQGDGRPARRGKELELESQIQLDNAYVARDLLNLMRARTYPPHPGSFFIDGDRRYEIRISIEEISRG